MSRLPKTLEDLIAHFSRLPGVGPKTAARLAFFMLAEDADDVTKFAETLQALKTDIKTCEKCFNISEDSVCHVCSDDSRDTSLVCVVEEPLDIIALEKTHQFNGQYHVLGGVISPLNGVGPEDLEIASLLTKAQDSSVKELVLATNANVEGEATAMYIAKQAAPLDVQITRLAGGLPFGSDLEYTDEMTLEQALTNRREYKQG